MKILLVPQVPINEEDKITYSFNGNIVTANYKGIQDTFNFNGLPEGKLIIDLADETVKLSNMEHCPLVSAKKENGILYLELINYIPHNASYEERFPEWIDAKDYVSPIKKDETVEEEFGATSTLRTEKWDEF